jgi:UDP:flavonoid glycosyltransferase YjiC (YdhE family)
VDKFSPGLTLALFSKWLAEPAPDWPAQTVQPGFVFFNQPGAEGFFSRELQEFLAVGEAPIVFTQGSTAVHNPGRFYEVSLEAARRLGRRAVLLGTDTVPGGGAEGVIALPYAPYSQIFPDAAVIVHQGGSGTTGEAMRACRPMLIVPYGWDQPDNAARIERLGVGLALPRHRYLPSTAAAALQRLLVEARFHERAVEIGEQVRAEDGLSGACDAIEASWLAEGAVKP